MAGVQARGAVVVLWIATMSADVRAEGALLTDQLVPPVAGADANFDYLVVEQDARALFETLARDFQMRLDLSDKVRGRLSGQRLSGDRDQVLDSAAQQLGLDWFFFNGVLYVSNRGEGLTRIVRLGDLEMTKVMSVLDESGLVEKLEIKPASGSAAIALSGPPKLLALAETMIEGIPPAPVGRAAQVAARVITIRRANEAQTVQLP